MVILFTNENDERSQKFLNANSCTRVYECHSDKSFKLQLIKLPTIWFCFFWNYSKVCFTLFRDHSDLTRAGPNSIQRLEVIFQRKKIILNNITIIQFQWMILSMSLKIPSWSRKNTHQSNSEKVSQPFALINTEFICKIFLFILDYFKST